MQGASPVGDEVPGVQVMAQAEEEEAPAVGVCSDGIRMVSEGCVTLLCDVCWV